MNFSVFEMTRAWAQSRGLDIWSTSEVDSTSNEAKRQGLEAVKTNKIYLADQQSSGRGRGDHIWNNSGPGDALLSTWAYRLPSPAQHITAPLLGLAVFEAAMATWPAQPFGLKAPNDLLLDRKKVGGLLTEALSQGEDHLLLVGLGINVFAAPKDVELAGALSERFDVQAGDYNLFLNHLERRLHNVRHDCQKQRLDPVTVDRLTKALKSHPRPNEIIEAVMPQGDLVVAGRRVPWQDI